MGYLIGQLGGLLPIPGGVGRDRRRPDRHADRLRDAGGRRRAAAVLAYRVILFWLPLLVGAVAFISLRRGLNEPDRPDLCVVPDANSQPAGLG